MKTLKSLALLFKSKRNKKLYLLFIILITFLYFVLENLGIALRIIQIPLFSTAEKIKLFVISLFNTGDLQELGMLLLVIFLILSLALFLLLFINLYQSSKKISQGKNVWGTVGILISILGISCASCGIGLLASLLSFFGSSYLISYFPLHGLELGYIGIICLNISNYFLLKRFRNPYTCD